MTCPRCGHPRCDGATPRHPHHGLCCLDGQPRACWGRRDDARIRNARRETPRDSEIHHDHTTPTWAEAERDWR